MDAALRTSAEGVFAAGDCAELRAPEPGRRATEPLWYTARKQGLVAAHGLTGAPRPYRPGVFYNSAKFFDLEYQAYGRVEPAPRAGEASLLAQSRDGRRAVRIQFVEGANEAGAPAGAGQAVVGFNLMGVRFRQDVCTAWIAQQTPLREVVARLGEAAFDPELSRPVERRLVEAFNARFPRLAVRGAAARGWRRWMAVNGLVGRDVLPGRALP